MVQPTLPLSLVRDSGVPLVVQVASRVRELVSTGTLAPGDRLPSIRALAAEIGIARALRSSPAGIRAVYVTPAHQHPLGITMSAGRRIALLA